MTEERFCHLTVYMVNLSMELLLVPTLLLILGFAIRIFLDASITWEIGYASGAIAAMILTSTIGSLHNNKQKVNLLFKNYRSTFTSIALVLAFIGGGVWTLGEYYQYAGYERHPIMDPLGAMLCFLSGTLSLVVHFS